MTARSGPSCPFAPRWGNPNPHPVARVVTTASYGFAFDLARLGCLCALLGQSALRASSVFKDAKLQYNVRVPGSPPEGFFSPRLPDARPPKHNKVR